MPKLAIMIGDLLILVGIVGYFATDRVSPTALIPSVFGVVLALLGVLALVKPGTRKHAMHAAAVLTLLGFAFPAWRLLASGFAGKPPAVWAQGIMAALCLAFLILAIRSFVAARRQRGFEVA